MLVQNEIKLGRRPESLTALLVKGTIALVVLYALLILPGCASWLEVRPQAKDVRVHYVADSQGICNRIVGQADIYLGCVWWNTTYSSCDVFLPTHAPQFVLDHELKHCRGLDHQ